ncbi:hypothetical protein LAUMK13_01021 [Mycobacterium innocens]|uniref:Uncharacterized protein n=1 Tax=Mycobacterium innocens TaxID=2341083 RepID=A0A498PVB1_9MYCO|nr:hypothetical protein LAUMK13_01021 [Mycobacterium innocens]
MNPHPRPVLHPGPRPGSARAEPPGRQTHCHRVDVAHCAAPAGRDGFRTPTNRQRFRQIAALSGDQPAEPVHRGAVTQRLCRVAAVDPGELQHLAGQPHGQLHDVGRSAAGQHFQGLGHLERVADGATQRRIHVRQQGARGHAMRGAEVNHGVRQFAGLRLGFQEGPGTDLHVEYQRARSLGQLLAHDRTGDQRQGFDGAGDVAQRIELGVGGGQLAGREDGRTDVAKLLAHTLIGQRRGEPGD